MTSLPALPTAQRPKKRKGRGAESGSPRHRTGQARRHRGVPDQNPQTVSPSERAILERLQTRRQELEQRAREIEIRESLLKAAEKRIDGRPRK